MARSRVKYRPMGEILCRFGLCTKDVQIIMGPLGSGKTKAVVFKIIKLLAEQRPDANGIRKSRVVAIRNTYSDLNTTTIREFKECVSPAMGSFVNSKPPVFTFNFELADGTFVEAEVDFLALDRPEDVRKLRGTQYTFAWLNEIKELPKAVPDMVLGRIDRFPTPGFSTWVGIIGDSNAWDEDHWLAVLHEEWVQGHMPGYEFFTQPGAVIKTTDHDYPGAAKSLNGTYWYVNPAAENLVVLRTNYYQRQIAGKKDDWISVNLGNELGLAIDGRAVHPEYQESVHRAEKNLKALIGIPVFVGIDFGLQPAALFCQRQPTGVWHALDEIVFETGDAVKLADAIKLKCASMREESRISPDDTNSLKFIFKGDPSGDSGSEADSQTAFKIMRMNGVPAIPASTNDPALRRDALTRPLTRMVNGGPGLRVSPRCKVFRKGMAGAFCYKRIQVSGDERFKDKPDKNRFSHVVEAGEYALMDAGEHSVSDATAIGVMKMPNHPVTPSGGPSGRQAIGPSWNVFNV